VKNFLFDISVVLHIGDYRGSMGGIDVSAKERFVLGVSPTAFKYGNSMTVAVVIHNVFVQIIENDEAARFINPLDRLQINSQDRLLCCINQEVMTNLQFLKLGPSDDFYQQATKPKLHSCAMIAHGIDTSPSVDCSCESLWQSGKADFQ
jgi:hypothetical protein